MIPRSRPLISNDDLQAMAGMVHSGMVGQGSQTAQLETELAARFGAGHRATALGCGMAGMQLALRALGVQPGDEVVLPTYICRAVLQAVRSLGAVPILCDIG